MEGREKKNRATSKLNQIIKLKISIKRQHEAIMLLIVPVFVVIAVCVCVWKTLGSKP